MKLKIPCKYISREILKTINSNKSFQPWMKDYLSVKEFYLIKNLGLSSLNINILNELIIKKLLENNVKAEKKDIEFIIRTHNKLIFVLEIIRSNIFKKNSQREVNLAFFHKELIFSLLIRSENISVTKKSTRFFNYSLNKRLLFIAPVCPDYSYELIEEGKYNYTFDSVGSNIGLVAQKAIRTFNTIKNLNNELNSFPIKFSILLGDFEANTKNLNALNETKENFLKKLNGSVKKINNYTSWETFLFCELCGGLDCWDSMIKATQKRLSLFEYNDLLRRFPNINHDKNLISRLPLYKKWYKNENDYKVIFFNQCMEYILMGHLVELTYGSETILLASDHRVMRQYYGLSANITIISSSANY